MKLEKVSGLDCIVKRSSEKSRDTATVFLHGYGASAQDLAPFADFFADQYTDYYFPDGPIDVSVGMGMTGKAWFPIDVERLEKLMLEGKTEDRFQGELPIEFDRAYEKLETLLNDLDKQYKKVVWGGFSQGAMLSSVIGSFNSKKISKLVLLSGALLSTRLDKLKTIEGPKLTIFQSHGVSDLVIPVFEGQKLHDFFSSQGHEIQYHEFQGSHEIPIDILQKLKTFLARY